MSIDRYAVFGHPVKHSKSPKIHKLFAEQTGQALSYEALDVPAEHFTQAVTRFFDEGGKGLNCTVPLKELAWQFADVKSRRAEQSKAVNTLALQADGKILGDNTDGIGLVADLSGHHQVSLTGARILILGAGGAARGILGPILERNPQTLVIANRTPAKAEELALAFSGADIAGCGFGDLQGAKFDLIINATSASLNNDTPPLPDGLLADNGVCYDLAYSNQPTAFVNWGRQQHAGKSLDGLGMLVEQAALAFFIWRGVQPNTQPVLELLNAERLV